MQRYHLTIVIVISAPSASPRPANRCDPPIEGWQRRRWRKKQKKKHIYWRLWQQRVKSFGLLSYSVPAPGCGWCYFWRGRGKASATCCSAGCRCQGVVCVWVTDWLCRCQAIASYILLCSVLFSRFNSFPAFVFFLRLQPLRCIPRATSICSFWDFGLLLGWVWVQVGLGWVGFAPRLGYHDHDIAQEQQQHVLEKQANNEANLFLFFFSLLLCVFFLTSFLLFSSSFVGVGAFFPRHGSNCALLQNTWNFQHEFTLFSCNL